MLMIDADRLAQAIADALHRVAQRGADPEPSLQGFGTIGTGAAGQVRTFVVSAYDIASDRQVVKVFIGRGAPDSATLPPTRG